MSINRIALYHLETLLWIDRLGTFAAAAERLNMTQPTISARVRELEQHVGARLFRRDGRTMSLTPAGRQLVRDCGPLWDQLQRVLLDCGGAEEAGGVIRIGAGEIVAASCLPAFLNGLAVALPRVRLETEIDLTANLIQHLLIGQTDIAFAAGPIAHPELRTAPIGSVALLWLANAEVAAAFTRDPARVRLWSLASHSPIHGRMRDAIGTLGIAAGSVNLCNNARLMIEVVRAGGGAAIFPESMVRAELARGALVVVEGMPPLAPIAFEVAMRAGDGTPLTQAIFERASRLRLG